nr:metalloregulator ArsR/SmtB family transcription factor [Clostridium sp. LY3-2]
MNNHSYEKRDFMKEADRCNCNVIHEEVVNEVKDKLPKEETLYDLAELFKVFGDTTRIKIICALYEAEMCVCDLAVLLNMTQSAISHQLRTLKANRLVKFRRAGKVVYYSLDDEHIMKIFNQGLDHVSE